MNALSVAAACEAQFSFRKMLSTWVPTVLGLIPRARAVSLLLAPLITSLETLSWLTTHGMAGDYRDEEPPMSPPFQMTLGWAFILTVVHVRR